MLAESARAAITTRLERDPSAFLPEKALDYGIQHIRRNGNFTLTLHAQVFHLRHQPRAESPQFLIEPLHPSALRKKFLQCR